MKEYPCSNQETHILFEHGFKLYNISNQPLAIYITLYEESTADQTDYFSGAFVCENVVHGYGVLAFESLQSTPFCLEKSSVRKGIV